MLLASPLAASAASVASVASVEKTYRAAKTKKPVPKFARIEAVVEIYFEKLRGFQPQGIIIESEVSPLLAKLKLAGGKYELAFPYTYKYGADTTYLYYRSGMVAKGKVGSESLGGVYN